MKKILELIKTKEGITFVEMTAIVLFCIIVVGLSIGGAF